MKRPSYSGLQMGKSIEDSEGSLDAGNAFTDLLNLPWLNMAKKRRCPGDVIDLLGQQAHDSGAGGIYRHRVVAYNQDAAFFD